MSCTRRDVAVSKDGAGWLPIALAMLGIAIPMFLTASPARGNMGYELATPDPVLAEDIEFPHGVAVDQVSHHVYVAVVTNDFFAGEPGEIRRFESDGDAAGIFTAGPEAYFSGVAVNPVTQGVYGSQVYSETPFGNFGAAQMVPFSSAGVMGTPFPVSFTKTLPHIATDSGGDVFFPDAATDSVRVFNSSGVLQEEITCGGCPGGAFGQPASVAIDSKDDLYVVDFAPDRVVKFTLSGGSYAFDSVLQSGRGAAAVGVDPSTNDVFVGDFPNPDGTGYHIVAYDSSGTQFDDFGAGLFIDRPLGIIAAGQIAADATTHRLYISETGKIYIFDRVTISPPSATADPVTGLGQLMATLNASVNAKGHAVLECEFEYTDEADFQANGFANAASVPCSKKPDGLANTPLDVSVSGLSPATSYRFRVMATSNAGSVTSDNRTFQTLPPVPPTVTTEAPSAIAETGATIKGRVNPHGGAPSDCHFEFGTSPAYGLDLPCSSLPKPVTAEVARSLTVSELAPGTAYHYRLVVTTNAGTTEGDDVAFTTLAPPPDPDPESPPVTTPSPTVPPIATPRPQRCRRGFRRQRVGGKARCVKICKRGFRRKRVRGKIKCVKKRSARHGRRHRGVD